MRSTKDICARALRFLEAQRLPPSPPNYWLAFTFVDGAHVPLGETLKAILDGGVRVTQAEASALHARFFGLAADPTPASRPDPQADAIRHHALRLADLAASAQATTGEFGRELGGRLPEIDAADPASLRSLFAAAIEQSRRTECELAATTTELAQLREKLEAVQGDAERDALTGLPNRRGIEAHFAAARAAGHETIVAMCDIDRFKSYNDRYGHAVGDRVLRTVAQSLRESLASHFVGRWGGEEFVVVASVGVAAGVAMIEEAQAALAARHFKLRETDEPMGRITFSAGVAALLPGDEGGESALARADALLYRAKDAGRDRVIGE